MSFFTFLPEGDPESPVEEPMRIPAWLQPDLDEVPVAVALPRVLARAGSATLVLQRADVYSEGVKFVFGMHLRLPAHANEAERELLRRVSGSYGPHAGADELRLGIELPGGATADTLARDNASWEKEPEGPTLVAMGGGGGGDHRRWDSRVEAWPWPLPPAGRAKLHFVYGALGIEEGSFEFDTAPLLEAVRDVIRLD